LTAEKQELEARFSAVEDLQKKVHSESNIVEQKREKIAKESAALVSAQSHIHAPPYWARRMVVDRHFVDFNSVPAKIKEAIQSLMHATWDSQYIGVGRDGAGMTHKAFEVLSVQHVENAQLWRRYVAARNDIKPIKNKYEVHTSRSDWVKTLGLDVQRNEVMLFTGMPSGQGNLPDIVKIIKHRGFTEKVAAENGMYGLGLYFAERCSKADAYAGRYQASSVGEQASMVLARVTLGNPYITKSPTPHIRRPPTLSGNFDGQGYPSIERRFDSVIFDGTGKNYKEFIVYNGWQCYPEFAIIYKRVR